MGQPWAIINPDKKETLDIVMDAGGWKQQGHCFEFNPLHAATCMLLKGAWRGDRVVLVGQYTEVFTGVESVDLDGNASLANLYEESEELFDQPAHNNYFGYSDMTAAEWFDFCDKLYANQVIVDLDNKQYLRIGDYFKRETSTRDNGVLIEHPVPLLLSAPGGYGGGDYPYPDDFGYGLFSGHRVGLYKDDDAILASMEDITDLVCFDVAELSRKQRLCALPNLPLASAVNI